MSSSFFDRSRDIADNFIHSVLFIDDEIYTNNDGTHNLESQKVVTAFTKAKKLCSLSCPNKESDLDDIVEVAKKTDVVVLDWRILFDNDTADDEVDILEEDGRGDFTIKVLKSIIQDPVYGHGSLKQFIVFTGETDLEKVASKLAISFASLGFERSDNVVLSDNVKIIVVGKPQLRGTFKHLPDFEKWVKDYDELPGLVLDEFAKMTSGLVSNFAIACLSTIRANTYKMLQLFSKDLDAAYLGHKSLLPSTEDAEDLLVDLLKDSIGDLLHYSEVQKTIDPELIKIWIAEFTLSRKLQFLNRKGKPFTDKDGKNLELNYVLTEDLIHGLIFPSDLDVGKRYEKLFKPIKGFQQLKPVDKSEFIKNIQVNSSSLFANEQEDYHQLDFKFANLTHHKNLFKPSKYPPRLSLGVVIRGTNNNSRYWVCIQQRCDSVRIKKGEIRKFLFLPLKPENNDSENVFHFTDPNGQRLRLIIKTHEIRTIKFQNISNSGAIVAEMENGRFVFKQYYSKGHSDHKPGTDEDFEWVFDLKDMHSQRISNDIARELSRVGLNESEWLRRWSTS